MSMNTLFLITKLIMFFKKIFTYLLKIDLNPLDMKKIKFFILIATTFTLSSCDVLMQTASGIIESEKPLTTLDVSNGLKSALDIGVVEALQKLNKSDGYFLDPLVKINLPPETQNVITNARKVPGLDKKIDEVILQINRAAEDAAVKAAPIFKDAIISMSIEDAWGILNGSENAATLYLSDKTYNSLMDLYLPIMQESLNKPIVANISAEASWNEITSQWNKFANSFAGKLLEAKPMNTSLDEYVTGKALDGVFLKVADKEKIIRTDVNARTTDLLKKVFAKQQ